AQFGQPQDPPYEGDVTNQMLAKIMGVPADFHTPYTYLNKLRNQYHADGAYFITIAPNSNLTASLRAHATIGGPPFPHDTPPASSTCATPRRVSASQPTSPETTCISRARSRTCR